MQTANMFAAIVVGLFVSPNAEWPLVLPGLTAIGLASFGLATSRSVEAVLSTQILHGLGHGLSFPVLMGLAIKDVASADRGKAMGVFQSVYALGMFCGPAIAGFLAERYGIKTFFVCLGVLMCTSTFALAWGLRRRFVR